jgi:intracellular sulfur oxidation DsrE/DsrF family protein
VLFNVTKAAPGDDEVVPGLERAARFVNLASLADVPDKNLQIVAVLHGPATAAVLADEAYLKRYQRKNPNRELIAALNKAGVTVMVCGQALAHQDFATSEVASDVTVAVAALTVLAQYQSAGYALMPN